MKHQGWCEDCRKLKEERTALLAEIEILRTKNKAFAGANDHLKEELDALQKENADLVAWADNIVGGIRALTEKTENRLYMPSRIVEFLDGLLSLPIPGNAERMREEVRREERERCAKVAEDLVVPGMAGQLASTRAFQFQIAEAIRAACEKGEENG